MERKLEITPERIIIFLPDDVLEIFKVIKEYGAESYIVGGSVRDSILGRPVHDWDICTPVPVLELESFFKEKGYIVIPTGLQHGTITVMVNGTGYEITTYRCDGAYSDGRHPDSVEFTSDLEKDLSRRDFTINAMAYNNENGLIDPFNGLKDIQNKVIKCVGKPEDRFREDALRILRAIRFACQLDFTIHPSIGWCIGYTDIKYHLINVSTERINSEFCKMIVCDNFYDKLANHYSLFTLIIPELNDMLGFKQNNPYHQYDTFLHTYHALENCSSNDLIVKLAVLFHDIGKPHCYQDDEDGTRHFRGHGKVSAEMTDLIMHRLKFDNCTREKVVELVHYHDSTFEVGKKYVKRWLNLIGKEQFRRLLEVRKADIKSQSNLKQAKRLLKVEAVAILLDEVLEENECFSLKDLVINGNDVKETMMLNEGKSVGYWLNEVLKKVIDGELKNNREDLIYWMTGVTDGWIKFH